LVDLSIKKGKKVAVGVLYLVKKPEGRLQEKQVLMVGFTDSWILGKMDNGIYHCFFLYWCKFNISKHRWYTFVSHSFQGEES